MKFYLQIYNPFFGICAARVKNIIRQNKKSGLQEFLFGKVEDNKLVKQDLNPHLQEMQDKIAALQNQVHYLQDRIRDIETILKNSKYALSPTLKTSEGTKIIQQADSTLKTNNGSYFQENNQGDNLDSNVLSEASKSPLKKSQQMKEYNIASDQSKAQNHSNFITLGKIAEQERIEIIQKGFQLEAEGKISLKNYYESTDPNSLFESKGYSIKYESIRRTKLYKNLKE
jgi:hypothetical protein